MTRLHRMALRMYLPTLACLLLAFVSTWLTTSVSRTAAPRMLDELLRWAPYGLLALAALLGLIASTRLMRGNTDDALICDCGGLLGARRQGRFGAYRKCAACGRNHAVVH